MNIEVFSELDNFFNQSTALRNVAGGKHPRVDITAKLEETFDKLIGVCLPDFFVEVGAFEASFSRRMANLYPQSKVIAFEANPRVFNKFSSSFLETRVDYRFNAVSDSIGEVSIHIPEIVAGNEMPYENRMASLNEIDIDNSKTKVEFVPSVTLDSIISDEFYHAAIWIDVEGAADKILDGARKTLSRTSLILCELENRSVWKDGANCNTIIKELKKEGFTPVLRDCQREFQFNVIFIRNSLLNIDSVALRIDEYLNFCHRILQGE